MFQNALSDHVLFPAIQLLLIAFGVICFVMERIAKRAAGRGSVNLTVKRGAESMAIFYGLYAASTGLFVSVSLAAESAAQHRVLFVVLDVAVIGYVCLLNPWFRNKLLGWAEKLKSIESR